MTKEGKKPNEFLDDPLVDKDGQGDSEDSDDCEIAAGPAEIELEILAAAVPILDELVLVHFHSSPHLSPFSALLLSF